MVWVSPVWCYKETWKRGSRKYLLVNAALLYTLPRKHQYWTLTSATLHRQKLARVTCRAWPNTEWVLPRLLQNQKWDVAWLLPFHARLPPVGFCPGSLLSFLQNNFWHFWEIWVWHRCFSFPFSTWQLAQATKLIAVLQHSAVPSQFLAMNGQSHEFLTSYWSWEDVQGGKRHTL